MGTCDVCGRDDLMQDGSCCNCCDKAVGVGLSELRRRRDPDRFAKFVAELADRVSAETCGCMWFKNEPEKFKAHPESYTFITDIFDKYYHR